MLCCLTAGTRWSHLQILHALYVGPLLVPGNWSAFYSTSPLPNPTTIVTCHRGFAVVATRPALLFALTDRHMMITSMQRV